MTAGPSGRVTFAYLTRAQTETSWRLCLAALALEKGTGKPVIARTPAPIDVVTDCLLRSLRRSPATVRPSSPRPRMGGSSSTRLPTSPECPGRGRSIDHAESLTEADRTIAMAVLVALAVGDVPLR